MNAPKVLKYNSSTNKWECTVPSNSYLSHFKTPTVSGVTFSRSGNNLKVSATTTGLANLEKAGAVKFTKTKAVYASKIEECTPLYLSSTKSQDKVSYDLKGGDPVKGYMAFEGDYGSVTITKTASDANGKTYTATSTANKALNSAVRFKLKASNGNWVNATRDASGKYTYTRHDSTATGAVFALDANGKFTVAGLPIGKYTLIETTTASGYTKAANKTFTVTDGNTTSTSVVNSQDSGKLKVVKQLSDGGNAVNVSDYTFVTADGEKVTWEELCQTIRFKIKDANGKYVTATQPAAYSGNYTYSGTNSTGTSFGLCYKSDITGAVTVGTFEVRNLPIGSYTIIECEREDWGTTAPHTFAELGITASANVSVSISKNSTATKTITNKVVSHGDLTIRKEINLANNSEATANDYAAVSFKIKDANGKFVKLTNTSVETGTYSYAGEASSEAQATIVKLGTKTLTATVTDLLPGNYIVVENVPDRFVARSDTLDVTVTSDSEKTVTFYNTEKTGSIQVTKATVGSLNLEGIEFILSGTSDSGRAIELKATTNENGIANFTGVPIGTYVVKENGDTVPTAYLTPLLQNMRSDVSAANSPCLTRQCLSF